MYSLHDIEDIAFLTPDQFMIFYNVWYYSSFNNPTLNIEVVKHD